MTSLRIFLARVWGMLRARTLDREFHDQIASHLEEATDEYVRRGVPLDDARRLARRNLGGVAQAEEAWREARSFVSLDHWRRDLRHAVRGLTRAAGFSIVVLIVLAIGIGATTSVFALLNTVVLRPLPFAESGDLVVLRHAAPGLGLKDAGLSDGLYFSYTAYARSLESVALYRDPIQMNYRQPGEPAARIHVSYASARLFTVLRTRPEIGRLFTDEDGLPGFMDATWQIPVLLSHEFWISRFGGDPTVVDRLVTINDRARKVVGVLPAGFVFPRADTQIWMLLEPRKTSGNVARNLSWNAVARMRRGFTAASVQDELARTLRGIADVDPSVGKAQLMPMVASLKSVVIGDVAPLLWLLFGGMTFLLLVACANAGGLFLVRTEHRAREMAVRRALGAHGTHLGRLFFIEAILLTGAAAAVGLLIARQMLAALVAFVPFDVPRLGEITLNAPAILLAAAAAVAMASSCGALSVRRGSPSLTPSLLSGGQWATPHRRGRRGGDALLALQVALALTLMVGSVLMVKTYRNLSRSPLGFNAGNVVSVEIGLSTRKAGQYVRIYNEVVERVRHLPQVESAAMASFVPLTASEDLFPVEVAGAPVPFKFVSREYFHTMKTQIIEGKGFAEGEYETVPNPVLISGALARRLFPGESAVGKTVRRLNPDGTIPDMRSGPLPPFTVAGIVGDVREMTLRAGPTEIVYIPVVDPPVERSIVPTNMRLVVRSGAPTASLITRVKQVVADVDAGLSVGQIQTMDAIVGSARSREAFVGVLLLFAAGASLFLGTVGVYGSVAQVVRRRTREIGIRRALGASPLEMVRMVVAGSVRSVLVGGAIGLAVALAAGQTMRSLLFGVAPRDPIVLLAVTGCLVAAAAVGALLAAQKATRIPPLVALRADS